MIIQNLNQSSYMTEVKFCTLQFILSVISGEHVRVFNKIKYYARNHREQKTMYWW